AAAAAAAKLCGCGVLPLILLLGGADCGGPASSLGTATADITSAGVDCALRGMFLRTCSVLLILDLPLAGAASTISLGGSLEEDFTGALVVDLDLDL
ncbi:MAG: hypothetical protein ACKPKO_47940, partial [Candidatus Fonsibacter sp.]